MGAERDDSLAADKVDQSSRAREDWQHVQRLRVGDAEAGHRFVQQHYPGVYHYLLYLTGRPELAEDLTQETFLQAWRRLDTFAGRAPLRLWLHRIAHREFLQAVRRPRPVVPLEEVAEVEAPGPADWAEAMVLQEAIRQLPPDHQQVVILHYLQGYDCQEIGQILRAPAGTVKYWLSLARTQLQRELGEGDLSYLNDAAAPMRQWAWLPLDRMHALETRLGFGRIVPMPAGAGHRRPTTEEPMERREFLRHAAVGAAGLMLPEGEKEIVDSRLTQKATVALKGAALSAVCEHLRAETGVHLVAGSSVADEKVTLFCEKLLLREVMRQLSRPFGYTWLRSGTPGAYHYELVQDLRSQLLEEELRNRDRNAALLALEKEIERYRPYLALSPDEALARAKTASETEKPLLERLAGPGWGVIQTYFLLTSPQAAALRAEQSLTFSAEPKPGEPSLPSDVARGVLQTFRGWGLVRTDHLDLGFDVTNELTDSGAVPVTAAPAARASVMLSMRQDELGRIVLAGYSRLFVGGKPGPDGITPGSSHSSGACATGVSPAVQRPDNSRLNVKLARDVSLRSRISLRPQASCRDAGRSTSAANPRLEDIDRSPSDAAKVSTADVLESVHRATGLPVVADFYTRLYPPDAVSVRDLPLFDALNQVADSMRMRWNKEGPWLQFRSTGYYDDRLKEVPNRLLTRWAAVRRREGMLPLDELLEIAQLDDAQLDGAEMAEGARHCYGLEEWELARNRNLRPHLRYLATFTPEQRRMAISADGLAFTRMSLTQQQQFLAFGVAQPLQSLEELAGAALRVEYTQPGAFRWQPGNEAFRWLLPIEPGPHGRRALMPPIRARTHERALVAARRIEPQLREGVIRAGRYLQKPVEELEQLLQGSEIVPTQLELVVLYFTGTSNRLLVNRVNREGNWQFGKLD